MSADISDKTSKQLSELALQDERVYPLRISNANIINVLVLNCELYTLS